jgi:murein L,D-transpeptidase YcbB/YkuD
MTLEQKTYYSHVNDKNKVDIVNLLKSIFKSHSFYALNDDAIEYIMQFQKNYGLFVDGIVGKNTISKMRQVAGVKVNTAPVTIQKPSGVQDIPETPKPTNIINFPLSTGEEKVKSWAEENKTTLLILLVVLIWIKRK